jgi:hypothetical protein
MSDEELVHFEATRYDWDGEFYELRIQHGLQHPIASWLDRWLGERLERLPGMQRVQVRVTAAQWNDNGIDDWGSIVFERISTPWPDPAQLREHVLAAVREAEETATIAAAEIRTFDEKLRATLADGDSRQKTSQPG